MDQLDNLIGQLGTKQCISSRGINRGMQQYTNSRDSVKVNITRNVEDIDAYSDNQL